MKSEIASEFVGEYATDKQTLAQMAYQHGTAWVEQQPKSWCSAQHGDRHAARRARREKRRQLQEHITSQMADVKPVGFIIPSFIFFAILSGIISWVVQKILQHYWPET